MGRIVVPSFYSFVDYIDVVVECSADIVVEVVGMLVVDTTVAAEFDVDIGSMQRLQPDDMAPGEVDELCSSLKTPL